METIYSYLDNQGIRYERHDHPALYTCEDAQRWIPHLAGAPTKNLFLKNRKGKRHFLCVVLEEKKVDLKALSSLVESTDLSFGSPERLKRYLGIAPGCVSLLALLHDKEHAVEVWIDEDVWRYDSMQCHPLQNTSTLVISREGMEKFFHSTGHTFHLANIPGS